MTCRNNFMADTEADHGKVIGQANPAEKKNRTLDERVINAYFNRRAGDNPYVAIEQLKQGRTRT